MQCFKHQDVSAIGVCKHCCKGLCASCATDLGFGLACHGEHEKQVQIVHAMVAKNPQIQSANRTARYALSTLTIIMGLLFLGFGVYQDGLVIEFETLLGAIFLLYGLYSLAMSRREYTAPKS